MWLAHQLDPSGALHNFGGYLELRGELDEQSLAGAIRQAVAETDTLRTRFECDADGRPWQVETAVEAELEIVDLRSHAAARTAAEAWMRQDLATSVDLGAGPLFTHALLRVGPDQHFFYFRYHHIVMDGYGQVVYWRRLAELYSAQVAGRPARERTAGTLSDLLTEEAVYRSSAQFADDRRYWLNNLAGHEGRLQLGGRRAEGRAGAGLRTEPLVRLGRLAALASRTSTHWSAVALAATAAYLHRITGQQDIVLAMAVRGRTTRTALVTPAMLANVLPLRLTVGPDLTFGELVEQVSGRVSELLGRQRYRGEDLHRDLLRPVDSTPSSGVLVNLVTFDGGIDFAGIAGVVHQLPSGPVHDLLIEFFGGADGADLRIALDGNPNVHDRDTLVGHRHRFQSFLDAITRAGAQQRIGELELLTVEERGQLLAGAHRFDRDYDYDHAISELVQAQALRTPEAVAVEADGAALTYRELVAQVQALAAHLRSRGVAPGDTVGVLDERSLNLVVELLAVMTAGAAYLPLDPELPSVRLAFQIEDSGARVVLSRSDLAERIAAVEVEVISVDRTLPLPPPADPLPVLAGPQDIAYVIYTSGSTGQPKGVAVPHRGVVNRLLWMQEEYGLRPQDRVLQKTPFTFDVSVWEFFWPLLNGAVLHLAAPGAHRDPRALAEVIRQQRITTVHFVPSMLDLFLAEPASAGLDALRRVFCSGEALRPETVGRFFQVYGSGPEDPELYNLYGPTEASIDVTHWRCRPSDAAGPVPIGIPVANTQLYVLDGAARLVAAGIEGELHIGGVQLAAGYLNRPELTAQSFIENPFEAGRLYRTGDLAVRRADGVFEYRGRLDQQVKVNGFRIEPGEIETALLEHPSVAQVSVSAVSSDGLSQLVAHVVAAGTPASAAELMDWLRERLPAYMVPARFVFLDSMPLLPNGKLDRKALPSGQPQPAEQVAVAAGPADQVLHTAWCAVLGISSADPDDSFFALGGDSMHAIRLRAELERHGFTFDVYQLFQGPSLRQLSSQVTPVAGTKASPVSGPFELLQPADRELLPDGLDDAYPLSAMQAGMLFHAALAEDSATYRVVTSVRVATRLDLAALEAAVRDTMSRHPSLRCSFDLTRYSEPLQLVHRDVPISVEPAQDLSALDEPAAEEAIRAWVQEAKFTSFDLKKAPLLRFAVHPRGLALFQLTVIEHHVVLDGWSDMRMLEEIVRHYQARSRGEVLRLPEPRSRYRDFVAAERRAQADEQSQAYWAELLRGVDPAPALPAPERDRHEPAGGKRRYDVPITAELSELLREVAGRHGLPLKSLLTAAHLAVLRLTGGVDEVVTGVVANGRLEELGGDEAVGVFLNTLPLRADLVEASFLDAAQQVFQHEKASMPHRRYPFAQMQQDIGEDLKLTSYVNFMDFHFDDNRLADGLMTVTVGVAETNYPLAVNFLVDPDQNRLVLWLDCDCAVVSEEFCDRLVGYYERALIGLARSPQAQITSVELLGSDELAQLGAWNDTATSFDRGATVHGLFERQAAARPHAVAVAHRHRELTYAELDGRANQLARHLVQAGVRRGDLVGVSVRRGPELVVSLLAVLKAGAAYVPMDPAFPRARLDNIAQDAAISCLIRGPGAPEGLRTPRTVDVQAQSAVIGAQDTSAPGLDLAGEDTAYVIYTSGSTGAPKGTAILHRNAVNFFTGMQQTVGCEAEDVVLAVTSVSFDISVLELLWPLTRGCKVVVAAERIVDNLAPQPDATEHALGFSLFFFAASAGSSNQDGYQLVLDAARFADTHGFEAVWTPERHFNAFGGLYPNPSVMSAALAAITDRIAIRCGSVVAPLHDTIRIAEEWSLVDNLSNGRVGLAFAAGWNSNDFVLQPDSFELRKERMAEQLAEFRSLWRGESVKRVGGSGELVDVRIFPSPVQPEPPIWLTSVGTVQTFEKAGRTGANLLTHLLGQAPADLAEKIAAYRRARLEAGHQSPGRVSVMVHTFMAEDTEHARAMARAPFREYLLSSTELWRTMFATTGRDFPEMGVEEQLDAVVELAVERYFETSGLFGSPDSCAELVRTLAGAGVDELACLVDFGLPPAEVLQSLGWVDVLRREHEEEAAESSHSFTELCRRHQVTVLQGTPSLLAAVAAEPAALGSLSGLRALLVGGEAFPSGLAQRLLAALPETQIFNMYGPTETTIWSTVHALDRAADADAGNISIGRPIANTTVRVVDRGGRLAPIGISGELWIGGEGVAVGYLGRPELTAEKFVEPHSADGVYYRTGDRVRWRRDGALEFLGRVDRQVKILGHRIEPDEVESVLSRHPMLDAVAVVAVEGRNGPELVAYVSPAESGNDPAARDAHVLRWSDVWDSAYDGPEADSGFAGWLSSYTGEPIPAEQMQEWLDHTVARVRALRPDAVADVGVGVGLLLRSLADQVSAYHGIDISAAALRAAARCLPDGRPLPEHVQLVQAGPEYLARLSPDSLDTVVINSVAQYFPGLDYLRTVLTDAVRAVRPGGTVFVGDVRSVEMLPEFHTSVQLHRATMLHTVDEVRSAIARQLQDERELCLSPTFFGQLAAEVAGIADVRIELKRGAADNELTLFRYDVSVFVGEPAPQPRVERTSWTALGGDLSALRSQLASPNGDLLVTGIPNLRLARTAATVEALARADGSATAWDLEKLVWELDEPAGAHPEEVCELARQAGCSVQLLVPSDGRLTVFDAMFTRESQLGSNP